MMIMNPMAKTVKKIKDTKIVLVKKLIIFIIGKVRYMVDINTHDCGFVP
jgi:hypothetical protein